MAKKMTTQHARPQPADAREIKRSKPPVTNRLTPEERTTIGRTARIKTPRESHAA